MKTKRCALQMVLAVLLSVLGLSPVLAANEIRWTDTSGKTDYVIIANASNLFWYTVTPALETYNAAHWTSYAIVGSEIGTTGHYTASFPTGIAAAGEYAVYIYEETTVGTPALGDLKLPDQLLQWSGSAKATLASINTLEASTNTQTSASTQQANNAASLTTYGTAKTTDVTTVGTAVAAIPNAAANGTAAANSILVTPANKLATASGGGVMASTVGDKTGYSGTATNFVAAPTLAQIQAGVPTDATIQGDAYAAMNQAAPGTPTAGSLFASEASDLTNSAAAATTLSNLVTGTGASTKFTAAAVSLAPTGGGGGGSDPWATALPGSYASGTAGYIVGTNLNAPISGIPAAELGAVVITIPGDHTTSGTSVALTAKQLRALDDAWMGGDNTSSVPSASGTATVTYYLRGAAHTSGNIVSVSTTSYDANKNQVSRTVLVAQPFPAVN